MKQAHILIFIISLFLSIGGFSQQKTDTIKLKENYGLRVGIDLSKPTISFIDRDKKKIYVANAGDSRCTMGKAGKAVEMSIDHKPESQIEIDRIEKAGSTITDGRVDRNLNLTRSLGDLKYKQRFDPTKPQPPTINIFCILLIYNLF